MEERIKKAYKLWTEKAAADQEIAEELRAMAGDESWMEDAFYRDLAFGTGGLRGVLGSGTNRMNIFTVAKASQGLADYVGKHFPAEKRKIAVSYDSRINSKKFAEVAAGVFAANGISVWLYSQLMPTPCLSFAVRRLECAAGIMVTASHNPAQYNGYKVYGSDGCQITNAAADEILGEIEKISIFEDVKTMDFETAVKSGIVSYIPKTVFSEFVEQVKRQSLVTKQDEIDKNVTIIYSPLNGTGLVPVLRTLRESGYGNIIVVKEQERPDGHFPTCPYPNPEIREAMALGIEYAKRYRADLLLATDPDCDRVGIAVRNDAGEYVLLTGNETGMLLLDYICSQREKNGTMPEEPVMVKTIVTTDMAEQIAAHYGVSTINVLTGFKYIGEQIGKLEAEGKADSYIFGFEESYGYLSGSYVRDKDGVNGVFLICEMFAFYKKKGIHLLDKLEELYETYGFCRNVLYSYEFKGVSGMDKMQQIMKRFRSGIAEIGGKRVLQVLDYAEGIGDLPQSDVIKFMLEDHCSVTVRPSGTEPKLKIYVSVCGEDREKADIVEERIREQLEKKQPYFSYI